MSGVDRLSITLPRELGREVRAAAAATSLSVSAWLTEAAAQALRNRLLGVALDEWEKEHGALSEAEIAEAGRRLSDDDDRTVAGAA